MLGLAIYKEISEPAAKGRGSASTTLLIAPYRTSCREGVFPVTEFPRMGLLKLSDKSKQALF